MKLIKLSIILFVLVVRPCLGKLVIATSNLEITTSGLVKDMGNILKLCYVDRVHGVGLVGNLPSTLSRTLSDQHSIPVVVVDREMNSKNMPRRLTNDFQYKLHVFIIEGSSTEQLGRLIRKTMKSVWWNHMASFFILDLSRGCDNAKDLLLEAWRKNMLNAKVMCLPRRNGRIIFNYNPFTSQPPVSWQRVEVFPGINKHPFTLLSRRYKKNETICPDKNFDKTKDLGGYTIRLAGRVQKRTNVAPGEKKHEAEEFHIIGQNILRIVYRALNTKVKYNGQSNEWDKFTKSDMIAHSLRLTNDVHKKMSYPIGIVGRNIVTRFRNRREPRRFSESFTVSDIDKRFGTPIVYLITLLLFTFLVDQVLVPVLLKCTRVIYNKSFIKLRDINPMRVYLIDVAFFVITIQAIFYANLTYPLTKESPLRNVETVEDLVDMGYTKIIGYEEDEIEYRYVGSVPKDVFEDGELGDCFELLQNSSSTACMNDLYFQLDYVEELNLHLNREVHIPRHAGFPIRTNWPLEERVNKMIARSVEANVLEPWYLKLNSIRSRIFRKGELDRNNKHVESIKLHEITFLFIFLGIGHVFATFVFINEVASSYRCACKIWFVRRYWYVTVKENGFVFLKSTHDSNV